MNGSVLDHLWNGWRAAYVSGHAGERSAAGAADASSVFTRILECGLDDDETNIVHRGVTCFVMMNAFPYTSGHVMVLPYREVADLEDLGADEHTELWATVSDAVVALKRAYRPDALNVGINLGAAAGGSVSGHLHVHVVPRWGGDSNFMTAVANTRTLPEAIGDSAARVRAAWGSAWMVDGDGEAHRDELPADLDAAGYVGPYKFPDNSRRRVPGALYLGIAAVCVLIWVLWRDDVPYVNDGWLWASVALVVAATITITSSWRMHVTETDALVAAQQAVGFPVGHASAQQVWRGLRSRPTWRVLCYSVEDPPRQRGLVLVDAIDGTVVEHLVEANPEE